MDNTPKPGEKTWVDEIQVQGGELVGKIQELLRDSTATRVSICKPNGEELVSLPLTVGVLAGGLLTLAAPKLAAIGAIGAIIAQLRLRVERHSDGQLEMRALEEESKTDLPDRPA